MKNCNCNWCSFIGSHMVDLLISKEYKVRIIDNFSGGHKNLSHLNKSNDIEVFEQDINQLDKHLIYSKMLKVFIILQV